MLPSWFPVRNISDITSTPQCIILPAREQVHTTRRRIAVMPDVKVTQGHRITAALTSQQNVVVVVIDDGSSSSSSSSSSSMSNDDVTLM